MGRPLAVAVLCGALALAADVPLRGDAAAFPSLSELPSTPFSTQDAALASSGLRAAAADIAWIQLLEYGGGGLPEIQDPPGHPYYFIKDLTLRIVRLDPHFHRAYLYGAGILGWSKGMERPVEAAELLQEGLRRDPGEKLFTLYLAALAYQKKGDSERMIAVLESTLDDPRAPLMMRPILANIYKSRGEYRKALALWEVILDDERQEDDHSRAVKQIAELKSLLKRKGV
jgi:tetratricopeptide (TPR) repeat protein